MPVVHGSGLHARDRPGAGRRSGADAGRGGADPLGRPHHRLLRPAAAGHRRGVRDSPRRALAGAGRRTAGAAAERAARRPAPADVSGPAQGAPEPRGVVRGRAAPVAPPAHDLHVTRRAGIGGAVHVAAALCCLRRRTVAPGEPGGNGRRPVDLRGQPALGRAGARLLQRTQPRSDPRDDRRAGHPRDHRAAAVPGRRRRGLPDPRPGGGHALGRRGAAHPAGDPDRIRPDGRALHPRRAVDRPAPAGQPQAHRHPRATPRPGQHGAGGRARRGHDAGRRPPDRHGPGGRRARWPRRRRGHPRSGAGRPRFGHRRVPVRAAADRDALGTSAPGAAGCRSMGPASTTCATSTSRSRSAS